MKQVHPLLLLKKNHQVNAMKILMMNLLLLLNLIMKNLRGLKDQDKLKWMCQTQAWMIEKEKEEILELEEKFKIWKRRLHNINHQYNRSFKYNYYMKFKDIHDLIEYRSNLVDRFNEINLELKNMYKYYYECKRNLVLQLNNLVYYEFLYNL